jgi:hypothetical protein
VLTGDDDILGARAAARAPDAAPAEIPPTRAAPEEAPRAGLKAPASGRSPHLAQRRRASMSHELRHRRGFPHPAP